MSERSLIAEGKMTGKSKKEELAQKRSAQILEAAARVFALKGYHAATTKEIAAEANVAEGTIYNYFRSKRELLLSMISDFADESLQLAMTRPSSKSDKEFLTTLLKDRFTLIDQNMNLVRVILREMMLDDNLRYFFFEQVLSKLSSQLGDLLKTRMEEGVFRNLDAVIAVHAMMGSFLGFILLGLDRKRHRLPPEELASQLADFFLNGLRLRSGEEPT
ncbi:MAG TPA: hypothetical protein DCP08_08095 [Chloroflexi bacterium]|nr:hypothetical protein [Chloroflexota bacterium]